MIQGELGDGPDLFGEGFTAADVMIGSIFIWKRMPGGPWDRPKLEAYVDRLLAHPAAMKIAGPSNGASADSGYWQLNSYGES